MLSNCGARENFWVSWSTTKSNQSILKKISPEYSLEGLMRKLKLQYFGHLMWRGFPGFSDGKESACNAGDLGSMPGLGSPPWEGNGNPLWFLGYEDPMEKGLATPSSILAWKIPWTEEPGGLQSTDLPRVGHDWATNTFTLLIRRSTLLKKTLMLEKTEGRRRRNNRGWDGWMASRTNWKWVWASSRRTWRTGKPGVL